MSSLFRSQKLPSFHRFRSRSATESPHSKGLLLARVGGQGRRSPSEIERDLTRSNSVNPGDCLQRAVIRGRYNVVAASYHGLLSWGVKEELVIFRCDTTRSALRDAEGSKMYFNRPKSGRLPSSSSTSFPEADSHWFERKN